MLTRFVFRSIHCLVIGCLAITVVGCGGAGVKPGRKSGTVQGTITLNGQPLTSGVVCLTDEADADTALGTIGPDGKFTVKYKLGSSIPTGKYKVTVSPPPPPQPSTPDDLMKNPAKYKVDNPIPVKYRTPKSTDLTAEVKEGPNALTLAMQGKS